MDCELVGATGGTHPNLEKRRQRGDLIEAYKIMTGKERVDPNCFFILDKKHYSTTGHKLKLYIRRSRLELRKNFFSQQVVADWNKLRSQLSWLRQ